MTTLQTTSAVIARRVYGPFREQGGLPGERATMRLDAAARAYLWNRYRRAMPAHAALAAALPVALRPHTDRRARLWYGDYGAAGAPFQQGRDTFRWFDGTAKAGLRFVGWADELPGGPDHTGWLCDEEGHETLRGGVWQLPGKGGAVRLLYGYAEFEGSGEMNPGSAALCVSDIVTAPGQSEWEGVRDLPETADAARWADHAAERAAETRRDDSLAYEAGRRAAELDAEAIEARREALELLAEMRSERDRLAGTYGGPRAICARLRRDVESLLETISDKRAERERAWGDCPRSLEDSWKAGFMDESEGGFVRAVRLGYASRDDWQGAPEANPCGALS